MCLECREGGSDVGVRLCRVWRPRQKGFGIDYVQGNHWRTLTEECV